MFLNIQKYRLYNTLYYKEDDILYLKMSFKNFRISIHAII